MSLADLITPDEIKCIQLALDVLPDSALNAIIAGMDIAIARLQVTKVLFLSEIANLDILLTPLVIERNALLAVQQTVVAQFKILDQAVVQQCVALGSLNQTLLNSIDNTTAGITNILNLINIKESYKLQLQSKSTALDDAIDFLGHTKGAFQTALQVRTQRRLVGQLPILNKLPT